jgi:hypothetical protein
MGVSTDRQLTLTLEDMDDRGPSRRTLGELLAGGESE